MKHRLNGDVNGFTLDGTEYVPSEPTGPLCEGCAFERDLELCGVAPDCTRAGPSGAKWVIFVKKETA